MTKKTKETRPQTFETQLGKPNKNEYSEDEKANILACETPHEFYLTGAMYGALRYCDACEYGYIV